MDEDRLHAAALRLLQVFVEPRERSRHGLMPHEFEPAFRTKGWTSSDIKRAAEFAYAAGWITVDGQYYCLTDGGRVVVSSLSD